ncbi:hypothetical protein F4814DRAFT_413933 [Daldinia grandis]|nr:hypothetical protein F4814DRAFT_413933 [Daldinia grandis]
MAANFRTTHFLVLFWEIVAILACQDASVIELRIIETTMSQVNRRDLLATHERLRLRDVTTRMSPTCGYQDGNPSITRTVAPPYDCRIDTMNGLWGFCSTDMNLNDCGLAGVCTDGAKCSTGCGMIGYEHTISCSLLDFGYCSTALIYLSEYETTYTYLACGGLDTTDTYLLTTTAELGSLTTSSTVTDSASESTQDSSAGPLSLSSYSKTTKSGLGLESTTASQQSSTDSTSTNIGAIIGGVLGALALVCGTVVAVVYILRRNRRPQHMGQGEVNTTAPNKHVMSYNAVPPSEADSSAMNRDQIQSFEMYSAPSSWQQHRELVESG